VSILIFSPSSELALCIISSKHDECIIYKGSIMPVGIPCEDLRYMYVISSYVRIFSCVSTFNYLYKGLLKRSVKCRALRV
jgi:hypothetical protein